MFASRLASLVSALLPRRNQRAAVRRKPFRPGGEVLEDRRLMVFHWQVNEGQQFSHKLLTTFAHGAAGEFDAADFKARVLSNLGQDMKGKVDIENAGGNRFSIYWTQTFHDEGPVDGVQVEVALPATKTTPARTVIKDHGAFQVLAAKLEVTPRTIAASTCNLFHGVVATFRDLDPEGPEPVENYRARIRWNDGPNSSTADNDGTAKIVQVGNEFHVIASHTFRQSHANRAIMVEVVENDGGKWGEANIYQARDEKRTRGVIAQADYHKSSARSYLDGNTLKIEGDDGRDETTVRLQGTVVVVQTVSQPPAGCRGTTQTKSNEFPASRVSAIEFLGREGDDRFSSQLPKARVTAWGGPGNDTLSGGAAGDRLFGNAGNDVLLGNAGDDLLVGGEGHDTLRGGANHDDLYGGDGNDRLFGDAGLDGLHGGAGINQLTGGPDADRFLAMDLAVQRMDEILDETSDDATITFSHGDRTWTDEHIRWIDIGLRALHHKTGNAVLLKTPGGLPLTLLRQGVAADEPAADATNMPQWGRIEFYDRAFRSYPNAAVTAVHEIGHGWQHGYANPYIGDWFRISDWRKTPPAGAAAGEYLRSGNGQFYYHKNAGFASNYGRTSPYEDWATAWESYFIHDQKKLPNPATVQRLPPEKVRLLDQFFASLSR